MKRIFAVIGLTLALSACGTITLDLTPRTQGETAHGIATRQDHGVVITTSDRTYNGHWTYVQGGSVGAGTAFAPGVVVTGTAIGISMSGAGNIVASTSDGHHIHCVFNYSQMSNTGDGECQNDEGLVYDLQIVKKFQ
jgi:uncharacterized protein YceK